MSSAMFNPAIDAIPTIVRDYFLDRDEIAGIYLFGSILGRAFNLTSDIDIGLLMQDNALPGWELINQDRVNLSDLLKREVDLVVLNQASPILNYQVLKTGKCILSRLPSRINQHFVTTINEYFDLKMVRQLIEKTLSR